MTRVIRCQSRTCLTGKKGKQKGDRKARAGDHREKGGMVKVCLFCRKLLKPTKKPDKPVIERPL